MTRSLLFPLFFVLLAADTLGLNLSLAPGLSVKNGMLYAILAWLAIEAALKRNRDLELLSVIVPYGLCVFYALVTWLVVVLIIDYPTYSALQAFISLKSALADHLIVLLVFFYGVATAKQATWLLKAMIWTVIAGNAITVVDVLNIPDLGLIEVREDGRVGGPVGESNQFAAFLALFLPAALGLALVEKGALRGLALLGFAFSVVAFLMTASRGGLVAVTGGSLLGVVFLRRYISVTAVAKSAIGLMGFGVVALGVMYLAGYGDLLFERIVGITLSGNTYEVSSGRTFIWGTAFAKMFDVPLTLITGFGWDSYRYFPDFNLAPHNGYLKIFFELGVIGLLLVLTAFVNVLRNGRMALERAVAETRIMIFAFIFGLLGIMVAIFFVDLTTPWIFIWAYTGVAMRLAVLQRDTASVAESYRPGAVGSPPEVSSTV